MRNATRRLAEVVPDILRVPPLQIANLGAVQLENGQIIRECRLGYRAMGHLDSSRSNAVLVTPWFQGTSREVAMQIGPGKLIDSDKYFVIAVDALGNGVSSSPSNSVMQPGDLFPTFTIRDVVESQYLLMTRICQLTHLRAVVGISMGGMQVFHWLISYPDFMDKGVSIVGSPQVQADDQQRWRAYLESFSTPRWKSVARAALRLAPRTAFHELVMSRDNRRRQTQAMIGCDITRSFGGSMERTADTMRADLFVVGTQADEELNPRPAFEFARVSGADVLELDGRCGHQAPSCERATLWPAVARFLDR
jgi:homoserine O-acetyltransferase